MSAAKWTAGPWRVIHYHGEPLYVGPFELIGSHRRAATAEDAANAHLCAAAPELYAALEGLLAWEQEQGGWEAPAWQRARAALGKAGGA